MSSRPTGSVWAMGNNNNGQAFLADNIVAGRGEPHVALTKEEIAEKFVDVCVTYVVGNAGLLF